MNTQTSKIATPVVDDRSKSNPGGNRVTLKTRSKARSRTFTGIKWRDAISTSVFTVFLGIIALLTSGKSNISFKGSTQWFDMGVLPVPSKIFCTLMFLLSLVMCVWAWNLALKRHRLCPVNTLISGLAFVCAFLVWVVAGKDASIMPMVPLLAGSLGFAVPLIFGSLSGVVCERTGVINLSIEGQLLFGAFLAAVLASVTKNPYVGLVGAPLGGLIMAVLLALFAVNFRADQIVAGVVLNMLSLGLTSFLYESLIVKTPEHLNSSTPLPKIAIPFIVDIPIVGPVFFKQSVLVYLMYVVIVALQIFLFKSKWGIRSRACGEHPRAADTVGIKVNQIRWLNVILGGALAGLGGAFFTIGSGIPFDENCSAGNGFIALAAMILGKWNPKGAVAAAALFGFATNLSFIMQTVNAPIPSQFVSMLPYLITILAVAGYVGLVRPPAAENKPYPA